MTSITDVELATVARLAERQLMLEAQLADAEQAVKAIEQELTEVSQVLLPSALAETGLSEYRLTNGKRVTVNTEIYASIPKARTQEAFAWLRQHGHDALIKNVISTEFGRGEDAKAIEAAQLLLEAGYLPEQRQAVHPQTLKAFLREQIMAGKDVPLDLFGGFIINRSKVSK